MADVDRADITGLILAGGRGERMGGMDKGLQEFKGQPLVTHALQRLQTQVRQVIISANRHLPVYQALACPVYPDVDPDFAGPLAGFLTGLSHCSTPWLATCPCDVPLFPSDLVERLAQAAEREGADMAMALALEEDGQMRTQPVFCLLKRELRSGLQTFLASGNRKIGAWVATQRCAKVSFDRPQDGQAFTNINTTEQLRALENQVR